LSEAAEFAVLIIIKTRHLIIIIVIIVIISIIIIITEHNSTAIDSDAKLQRNEENEENMENMENERDDKAADKEWLLNLLLGTEEAQKERMAVQVAVPSKQIQETFQAVIDEASNGTQLQSLLCLLRTHRVLHNGRSVAMILFEWACRNFPNVAFLQDCVDIRNSEDDTGIVGTQMLTMVTSLPLWDQPRFQGWTPMQQLSEFHRMLNLFEVDISPRSPVHSSPNYNFQHINGMIFTYRCKHFHLFAAKAVVKMTGSKENLTAFGANR